MMLQASPQALLTIKLARRQSDAFITSSFFLLTEVGLLFYANEIGGIVCAAAAFVMGDLRVRAEWAGAGGRAFRVSALPLCRDDFIRGNAFFNPALDGNRHVVFGVGLRAGDERAEVARAGAAAAMLHAGHHIEAYERVGVMLPHLRLHALEIIDRVDRRQRGIAPAVIKNQLAAARF